MKEIRALTTLRALAALLVFLYHYEAMYAASARTVGVTLWDPLLPVWRAGSVGVTMFFVLSGFLITRLYFDRFVEGRVRLREYFVKRIARIWPLFLVLAAAQHVLMAAWGRPPQAWWIVTCTMTQGFFLDVRYDGLPTAWSLSIEESYYLVAPLVFLALAPLAVRGRDGTGALGTRAWARLLATLVAACALLAAAGLGAMWLAHRLGWTFAGFLGDPRHVLHATLAGRFPEFAIGIVAAFLHRDGWPERALRGARASWTAVGSATAVLAAMAAKSAADDAGSLAGDLASTAGVAIATAVLILALTREDSRVSRFLAHPLGVHLGKVSYGFYLVQVSLVSAPIVALGERVGPFRLLVLYALMSVACTLLFELIERPARRAIVRRFSGATLGEAA